MIRHFLPALLSGLIACAVIAPVASANIVIDGIDFGDDASRWARDGECDDPRFEGPGMTSTTLLDADIGHDATDCSTAYRAGNLRLRDGATGYDPDDSGEPLDDEDYGIPGPGLWAPGDHVNQVGNVGPGSGSGISIPSGGLVIDGINFGDDASRWARDNECDDPRFEGPGMTTTTLLPEDTGHDATDCATAYEGGNLRLRAGADPGL
ncbi:MAG TPA: hypothetical protein PL096_02030 [Micropepsaceae bacterium]|nr:hypothetical protein [Micropepsaceae bacterium]